MNSKYEVFNIFRNSTDVYMKKKIEVRIQKPEPSPFQSPIHQNYTYIELYLYSYDSVSK